MKFRWNVHNFEGESNNQKASYQNRVSERLFKDGVRPCPSWKSSLVLLICGVVNTKMMFGPVKLGLRITPRASLALLLLWASTALFSKIFWIRSVLCKILPTGLQSFPKLTQFPYLFWGRFLIALRFSTNKNLQLLADFLVLPDSDSRCEWNVGDSRAMLWMMTTPVINNIKNLMGSKNITQNLFNSCDRSPLGTCKMTIKRNTANWSEWNLVCYGGGDYCYWASENL